MNKLVIFALLISCMFAISDFNQRFVYSHKANANTQQNKVVIENSKLTNNDDVFKKITSEYKKYREPENTSKSAVKTAKVDLNSQQGDLLNVFTEKSKLSLKAVIFNENKYALIEIENISDKSKKVEKFNNGDMLQGFKLSIANNRQVSLNKNQQHINLIMYKTKL